MESKSKRREFLEGLVCVLALLLLVGEIVYMTGFWIPIKNQVCEFGCKDAGSPAAAQATIEAIAGGKASYHATQTAMPVITTYGDITIKRFYDSTTGRFIFICTNFNRVIPCSIQEEK